MQHYCSRLHHFLLLITFNDYMMAHLSTDSQDTITALFMASQIGHTSVVDALLKNGADPNLARTVSAE